VAPSCGRRGATGELGDQPAELVGGRTGDKALEHAREATVVPPEILRLRVVGAAALHGLGPRIGVAQVVEERPNVVDLVCQRYPQRAWRCVGQMLDTLLRADVPEGLGSS
jgi:hypothetical protein